MAAFGDVHAGDDAIGYTMKTVRSLVRSSLTKSAKKQNRQKNCLNAREKRGAAPFGATPKTPWKQVLLTSRSTASAGRRRPCRGNLPSGRISIRVVILLISTLAASKLDKSSWMGSKMLISSQDQSTESYAGPFPPNGKRGVWHRRSPAKAPIRRSGDIVTGPHQQEAVPPPAVPVEHGRSVLHFGTYDRTLDRRRLSIQGNRRRKNRTHTVSWLDRSPEISLRQADEGLAVTGSCRLFQLPLSGGKHEQRDNQQNDRDANADVHRIDRKEHVRRVPFRIDVFRIQS